MSISRLSLIGVGQRRYEKPEEVDLTSANWGWTAYPITADFSPQAISRLGQFGVGLRKYEPPPAILPINLSQQDWGWQSFPIDVPAENVLVSTEYWGWTSQDLTVCAQSDKGYFGSFNANVWPSCSFNAQVFGPRRHDLQELETQSYGWQPQYMVVTFEDPINIPVATEPGFWGWFNLPIAVSYSYDVQLQITPWGWQSFPVSVELPYDIDLQLADWGWRGHPVAVSFGTDVGLGIATYGWQSFPLEVEVPKQDIDLRKADWGWQSFPLTVRQTALLPGDIEAIAEAVYQKFVDEGIVDQIAWVFQRAAGDPAYPQTYHTRDDGHDIEVGPHTIAQTTDSKGNVTQTRQS